MLEVHSTKSFLNLPCAHAQFFDLEPDGSPGQCASIHGYDRSVRITFSGQVDENGWIVPFGELQAVKDWLEFYFDHTTVLPANDPRLNTINSSMMEPGGLLCTMRVLPYGVSMEMSALFIIENLTLFISHITKRRCYVSKVECFEHERNSAFVTLDHDKAMAFYERFTSVVTRAYGEVDIAPFLLPKTRVWAYVPPQTALHALNGIK